MNFYNDNDPFICAWLRELINLKLIPDGIVDSRSIELIQPDELKSYTQCHFFAGIGGWSYALQLAGWTVERPVWTGSCPCQPISRAGKRKGHADRRHLWPSFFRLISKQKPPVVFGEQVAGSDGREWMSAVRFDLERIGYACGVADLCAAGVGAKHQRQRLLWVAMDDSRGKNVPRFKLNWDGLRSFSAETLPVNNLSGLHPWLSDFPDSIPSKPLDGLSRPVDIVRGYGNAIVPQVAAEFISAYLEVTSP